MTTQTRNEVLLEGIALEAPALSHENHGTRFYRFPLQVPRLSGTPDTLPVLVPEALLTAVRLEDPLRVRGQLRSFNNRSGVGESAGADGVCPNHGTRVRRALQPHSALRRPVQAPIFRRTPLGRSICDLMLAVSRRYGRADYLPVIAWGQLAVQAARLQVGDTLSLEGRVQSRTYRKVLEGRHRPGTGGLRGLRHASAGAGGGRVNHPPGRRSDDHGPAGRAQQHPALAPGQLLQQNPVESLPRRAGRIGRRSAAETPPSPPAWPASEPECGPAWSR